MTIDSKDVIIVYLKNNGVYPGDPQAFQVSTYINGWGKQTYHVAFSRDDVDRAIESPHVHNLRPLWTREVGLTRHGQWIADGGSNEK